ncbi:lysozyme [Myxosarcina sp. GI1(2024)]
MKYLSTAIALAGISTFGLVNLSSATNDNIRKPERTVKQNYVARGNSSISRDLSQVTGKLPPITFEAPTPPPEERVAINSRTAREQLQPQTQISKRTLQLIREFEGFRARAYLDTDGTPVIGYGLSKVNGKKVALGDRISVKSAERALSKQVKTIQQQIDSAVTVELNENQLGALSSIVFNVGTGFIHQSTLIKKLNAGDYQGAANEFLRWNKANVGGRLVPLSGLSRRRQAEKELFLTPVN